MSPFPKLEQDKLKYESQIELIRMNMEYNSRMLEQFHNTKMSLKMDFNAAKKNSISYGPTNGFEMYAEQSKTNQKTNSSDESRNEEVSNSVRLNKRLKNNFSPDLIPNVFPSNCNSVLDYESNNNNNNNNIVMKKPAKKFHYLNQNDQQLKQKLQQEEVDLLVSYEKFKNKRIALV
jgi:hypothetical protein